MVDQSLLSSTFLVEGVLMMAVAICGVGLNTVSVFHFAKVTNLTCWLAGPHRYKFPFLGFPTNYFLAVQWMARPMNAPTPNHNLSWKSVTQLNPINPGAFIQLLVLDIFQIYLIFSPPSIRASNVMFQVKHQRAFHRLLLSLAIMDNIYLVLVIRYGFPWSFCPGFHNFNLSLFLARLPLLSPSPLQTWVRPMTTMPGIMLCLTGVQTKQTLT